VTLSDASVQQIHPLWAMWPPDPEAIMFPVAQPATRDIDAPEKGDVT